MLDTLIDKPMPWLQADPGDTPSALWVEGTLRRNLPDFPFADRCEASDRRSIEERVSSALRASGWLAKGDYVHVSGLDPTEVRLLLERRIVTSDFANAEGSRAVFFTPKQDLSILVNGSDHVVIRTLAPGLRPGDVWRRLSQVEDGLAPALPFAFDARKGYLTRSLSHVGSGLTLSAALHLPGLALMSRVMECDAEARQQRHALRGLFGPVTEAPGDLYLLSNQATLGRSEEELAFHLRHTAADIIEAESKANEDYRQESALGLEDRLGRATGIARGARIMDWEEALHLLSVMRQGLALDMLPGIKARELSELLITTQEAHLALRLGPGADALAVNTARASRLRDRFAK
jgi:protein arginine kinase